MDAADQVIDIASNDGYLLQYSVEAGIPSFGIEPAANIADSAIEIGGRLPINTHGGQLGEAYIRGTNGIAEGVRQLRGTSVNQVPDVEHVLVTAGTGVPTVQRQNSGRLPTWLNLVRIVGADLDERGAQVVG